jgi:hypothetical protein
LLAASGLALVSLLILMGRGEAVPAAALWILPLGSVGGALWMILRRPRAIDAAMEADRQLGLADLLSTALSIIEDSGRSSSERHPTAEAFAAAVVAMADARCGELSASSVVFHRLGVRAWGGIGLAAALVISLTLVAANPLDSQASTLAGVEARPVAGSDVTKTTQMAGMAPRLSQAAMRPIVADHPNTDENAFNPARASSNGVRAAGESHQGTEAANPEGAGPGVGTSHATNPGNPLAAEGTSAANSAMGRTPAGGVGLSSSEEGVNKQGSSGGAVGRNAVARVTPVWKSSAWPAAQEAARAATQAGQIPQEYQDLVRAYFDR